MELFILSIVFLPMLASFGYYFVSERRFVRHVAKKYPLLWVELELGVRAEPSGPNDRLEQWLRTNEFRQFDDPVLHERSRIYKNAQLFVLPGFWLTVLLLFVLGHVAI